MEQTDTETIILRLAGEIIHGIGVLLNVTDAGNLRLSCKRFNEILEPSILQKITLNINRSNLAKSIPKLRTLAAGRSPGAARATTHLVLSCCSPSYDPAAPSTSDNPVLAEVAEGERRLRKYLYDAISSLKNVNSVKWVVHEADDVWVQNTIMKALKVLPQLEHFNLDATYLKIAAPIHRLEALSSLDIKAKHLVAEFFEQTCSNISKLFARNSRIRSLSIIPDDDRSIHGLCISFHSFFHNLLPDAPPLRLQHLTLNNISVGVDAAALSHLKYLQTLSLSYVSNPEDGSCEVVANKALACKANGCDDIWTALTTSGIHLEGISLNQPTASFLGFLESYSGLKMLTVSTSGINIEAGLEQLAMRFWTKSLRQHFNTLEYLHINGAHRRAWSLGDFSLLPIINCTSLRSFSITIPAHSFASGRDTDSVSDVTDLIDNISCYCPRLGHLTLFPSNTNGRMEDFCDPLLDDANALLWLKEQIQAYIAPPSCRHLPYVTVGFQKEAERYCPTRVFGSAVRIEPGEWQYIEASS